MAIAPSARAEWLKQRELSNVGTDAVLTARWGEDAADTSQSSIIVLEAAAVTETGRQQTFLASGRGRDIAVVEGAITDLEGETVDIEYAGELGIAGVARMLVLRSRANPNTNTTEIEGEVVL